MITHDDGTRDKRYTFEPEYTGHISGKPRIVARFCGEYIGEGASLPDAVFKAVIYRAKMRGAESITEQRN